MIRINLAPDEELDNPFWYVVDIAVVMSVIGAGCIGVYLYFQTMEADIVAVEQERNSYIKNYQLLADDQAKADKLDKQIKALEEKVNSLKDITKSKITRFRPVIILEHLQNLKPEGVWFQSINFNDQVSAAAATNAAPARGARGRGRGRRTQAAETPATEGPNSLEIRGSAFDQILVAELISALKATDLQEVDPGDLRTQVSFEVVELQQSAMGSSQQMLQSGNVTPSQLPNANFTIRIAIKERSPTAEPETPKARNVSLQNNVKNLVF